MSDNPFKSSGITFVGVRTKHVAAMRDFVEQILGYKKTHDDGEFVALTTPSGQRFELFAEDTPDKRHFPLGVPVPGFEVADFDAAVNWLKANNYELFSDGIGGSENGTRWAHFRGPDGNVYEFVYHPGKRATLK